MSQTQSIGDRRSWTGGRRAFWSGALAILAALSFVAASSSAALAINIKDSTSWANNVQEHWLHYDYFPSQCDNGGNGYRLYRAQVKFTRADSQFSAKWNQGMMQVLNADRCWGGGIVDGAVHMNFTSNNGYLNTGSTYTWNTSFFDTVYLTSGMLTSSFGSFAKVDLLRSGSLQTTLCTAPYVVQMGDPC